MKSYHSIQKEIRIKKVDNILLLCIIITHLSFKFTPSIDSRLCLIRVMFPDENTKRLEEFDTPAKSVRPQEGRRKVTRRYVL
nr:hypothetical protein [Desulfobacterales bacterium]